LIGEDGNVPLGGNGGRGVILGREDVAGRPAHIGSQCRQRLDQHGGLNGHVQRADDARALQRLFRTVFLAERHQARHFGFGDIEFLAAEIGQIDVGLAAFGFHIDGAAGARRQHHQAHDRCATDRGAFTGHPNDGVEALDSLNEAG
jgi:hypothetical protein